MTSRTFLDRVSVRYSFSFRGLARTNAVLFPDNRSPASATPLGADAPCRRRRAAPTDNNQLSRKQFAAKLIAGEALSGSQNTTRAFADRENAAPRGLASESVAHDIRVGAERRMPLLRRWDVDQRKAFLPRGEGQTIIECDHFK